MFTLEKTVKFWKIQILHTLTTLLWDWYLNFQNGCQIWNSFSLLSMSQSSSGWVNCQKKLATQPVKSAEQFEVGRFANKKPKFAKIEAQVFEIL